MGVLHQLELAALGHPDRRQRARHEIGSFTVASAPIDTITYRWEPMAQGAMGNLVLEWEHTRMNIHVHPGGD